MSPKKTIDFPARLDFFTTDEQRVALISIGYLTGTGGEYATPARNLLEGAIERYLDNLDAKKRAQYQEILKRVLIREGLDSTG